ncbi:MAG: glycosyltransferase, partial [Erysipelotrichaceae bacterium]|nr:glycosyltransferase [Erysipelotrichaceae bacterium]
QPIDNDGLVTRTASILSRYKKEEVQVAIAYGNGSGKDRFSKNNIIYYPLNADLSIQSIFSQWEEARNEILGVIEDYQPDIIQCFGTEWPYGLIAQDTRIPLVIHVMGFYGIYAQQLDSIYHFSAEGKRKDDLTVVGSDRLFSGRYEKDSSELTDQRLEVLKSSFERKVMEVNRFFFGRTNWDKRIVRYYSPQASYFHIEESIHQCIYEAAGTWKPKRENKLRIVTISSGDDRKGNEIILRTALLLKELIGLDFEWRVAGHPEYFARYEEISGINHYDVNIVLLGMIDSQRVISELQEADLFIHPSLIDNSANSICEAQLIGTPVIASDVGGTADIIKDRFSGMLYPYNEAHSLAFLIAEVANDEDYLLNISKNEVEIAIKRHDPEKIADSIVEAYHKIIDGQYEDETESTNTVSTDEQIIKKNNFTDEDRLHLEQLKRQLKNKEDEIAELQEQIQENVSKYLISRKFKEELVFARNRSDYEHYRYRQIKDSTFWKLSLGPRKLTDELKTIQVFKGPLAFTRKIVRGEIFGDRRYRDFETYLWNIFDQKELETQRRTVFPRKLTFSIIVPLCNTDKAFLEQMIASVKAQTYHDWQLCLADGSDSLHSYVGKICRKQMTKDSRICYRKLEDNFGISVNSNAALQMAEGEYIALLDHDDVLHPSALFEMMKAICEKEADFLYTDEATFASPDLENLQVIRYKPAYGFDDLLSNNYICHFTAFDRKLLDKEDAFRSAYDGSQDHDLFLRLTKKAKRIVHIPKLLYFWRSHGKSTAMSSETKRYASSAGIRVVQDYLTDLDLCAEIDRSEISPTIYRIRYLLPLKLKVSIIIFSNGKPEDLKRCLSSIVTKSAYDNYEIIIVRDDGLDLLPLSFYDDLTSGHEKVTYLNCEAAGKRVTMAEMAVKEAKGEILLFLNCAAEIISADWIKEMLMHFQRQDVGAVGGKLYYPDGTICHAGYAIGFDGMFIKTFWNQPGNEPGYMDMLKYVRNVTAISSDCMMIRKSLYKHLNGFDPVFSYPLSDIDLSLRLRAMGKLIVWTPYAEAFCHVRKERQIIDEYSNSTEKQEFIRRWATELSKGDPYYDSDQLLSQLEWFEHN